MNISDWVLIITTLFLGATALLVPVVSEFFKRNIFAPKLQIDFKLTPPYCLRTYWRSSVNPNLQEPVYYFRFKVMNNGRLQARLCEAVLETLWIYDSAGAPQRLPNFSDVNLHWAGRSSPFIDINPHRSIFCDIGHISSISYQKREEKSLFLDVPGCDGDDLRFLFDQLQYPYSQPNCLTAGKYGVKISLYSENTPKQEVYFVLSWSGKWQDGEHEMFRELVIQQVEQIQ